MCRYNLTHANPKAQPTKGWDGLSMAVLQKTRKPASWYQLAPNEESLLAKTALIRQNMARVLSPSSPKTRERSENSIKVVRQVLCEWRHTRLNHTRWKNGHQHHTHVLQILFFRGGPHDGPARPATKNAVVNPRSVLAFFVQDHLADSGCVMVGGECAHEFQWRHHVVLVLVICVMMITIVMITIVMITILLHLALVFFTHSVSGWLVCGKLRNE